MDELTRESIQALMADDEDFIRLVKTVAAEALRVQLRILKHGTPTEKLAIARAFMGVYAKSLQGEKTDKSNEDVLAETRKLIGNILPDRKAGT